jgi:Ca-activated chloride channel family protein
MWPTALRPHVTFIALAALAAVAAVVTLSAQSVPVLRIASPTADAYLSGPVRLVARVDPPTVEKTIAQVVFFAGGRQVCTITRPPFDCDWDAGDRIVEHQIRAAALLKDGTRLVANVRTRGLQHTEVTDVDVVQITAVVTDRDGRFVRGLKPGDFKVYEDDRPQPLSHFASENIPLELVTALDISSSMTEALPVVKEAAKRFLAGLRPDDQVTVLGFNENIFTLARRSTDQNVRARAVDRMAAWGGTAVYDVILQAVDLLGRQAGRRSILLFTDGDDQSSHATLAAATARTEGSDATIYAIGQGRAVTSPHLQKLLRGLAEKSGGRSFFTDDQASLDRSFGEILEDLRSQYLLAFVPASSKRDGSWHSIRVEVAGGHQVRARQGYRLMRRQ